jgi:two-component system response regulator
MTNKTILLVEDHPNNVLLAQRLLKKNNITIPLVVARDGVEALDYLFGTGAHGGRDCSQMPGLVLLDLNLPRLDGLEVLKAMRADERTALLPVIVLTSSEERSDFIRACRLGANSYLRKPLNFDEFIIAIKKLGLDWLGLNQSMS